jgi:A/G-specific adenine glycosylase
MLDRNLIRYFRTRVYNWARQNPIGYPWRSTDNLWHAMVAEILLQRTKADQVLPVYKDFVIRFPTPEAYKSFIETSDENVFENLGLNWRFEYFKKMVNSVVEEGIPIYKKNLQKLPGVGNYVSSALLSFHLNKREVLIDSNIIRFYGRFFGIETNEESRRKKNFILMSNEITPLRKFKEFNYAVLDYSMNICKPKPLCSNCLLLKRCHYYNNQQLY